MANPAQDGFLAALGEGLVFCQVLIRRAAAEFELRHMQDMAAAVESLRMIQLREVRELAQTTAAGAFRPLKSAPNLRAGWRLTVRGEDSLFEALNALYPGAVADWFAARSAAPPVTDYRQFTSRQTGMYRITATLANEAAEAAVAACCHEDFCLKRRLWSVGGLGPEGASHKSLIPCLEPCAVMLEFARKVGRWEQGVDAPERGEASPAGNVGAAPAECDFDAPANPRRQRFVLEKRRRAVTSAS